MALNINLDIQKFAGDTHRIYYYPNGGTGTLDGAEKIKGSDYFFVDEVESNLNSTYILTNTLSYDGHIFKEWNTASDGSGISILEGITNNQAITLAGTASPTLYAIWEEDTPTVINITLNSNGATTTRTTSATVTLNDDDLSDILNPQKTDYVFKGWYTAASGGSKVITDENTLVASVSNYTDANGNWIKDTDTTLYAQWDAFVAEDGLINTIKYYNTANAIRNVLNTNNSYTPAQMASTLKNIPNGDAMSF